MHSYTNLINNKRCAHMNKCVFVIYNWDKHNSTHNHMNKCVFVHIWLKSMSTRVSTLTSTKSYIIEDEPFVAQTSVNGYLHLDRQCSYIIEDEPFVAQTSVNGYLHLDRQCLHRSSWHLQATFYRLDRCQQVSSYVDEVNIDLQPYLSSSIVDLSFIDMLLGIALSLLDQFFYLGAWPIYQGQFNNNWLRQLEPSYEV
jgi:hypothetical protein